MNDSSACNFTSNLTTTCETTPPGLGPNPWTEFRIVAFGSAFYMIVVSLVTVAANALLLVVFLVDPLKMLKSPTSYFLIGLAISDLLTAMIALPIHASCFIMLYQQSPQNGLNLCRDVLLQVGLTLAAITLTISFLIVFAFTVIQFVVLASPLKYARMVTSRKIIISVFIIYLYTVLFWMSKFWGASIDLLGKIDIFLHALFVPYLTILLLILLHRTFKRKMAASKMLSNESGLKSRESNQNRLQRQFITVNCILLAILIICSQPTAMWWLAVKFWLPKPLTPKLLIVNLMIDNILYLKIVLNPFVYAWRMPKYREALRKICPVLEKCRRKQKYEKRLEESVFSQSRLTVMTLEMRKIESE